MRQERNTSETQVRVGKDFAQPLRKCRQETFRAQPRVVTNARNGNALTCGFVGRLSLNRQIPRFTASMSIENDCATGAFAKMRGSANNARNFARCPELRL
jgi:hypothetical protein